MPWPILPGPSGSRSGRVGPMVGSAAALAVAAFLVVAAFLTSGAPGAVGAASGIHAQTPNDPEPEPRSTAGPWDPPDPALGPRLIQPGLTNRATSADQADPTAGPDPDPAGPRDPTGFWLVEDETAVIHIEECDAGICGLIHWLDPEGDGEVYDVENPDEELRDRPLCGLEILRDFERDPDDPGRWEDGEIYAPDDGRTYSARVEVQGPDELEVRGYRGIALIGRSQTWTRVSPENFPECEPPA